MAINENKLRELADSLIYAWHAIGIKDEELVPSIKEELETLVTGEFESDSLKENTERYLREYEMTMTEATTRLFWNVIGQLTSHNISLDWKYDDKDA